VPSPPPCSIAELCLLRLKDLQSREGVMHFRIHGKRAKIRFVPVHPTALRLIGEYLQMGKHGGGRNIKASTKRCSGP
jgi:integrase